MNNKQTDIVLATAFGIVVGVLCGIIGGLTFGIIGGTITGCTVWSVIKIGNMFIYEEIR